MATRPSILPTIDELDLDDPTGYRSLIAGVPVAVDAGRQILERARGGMTALAPAYPGQRSRTLPTGELAQQIKGERPLGPDGEQPSPAGGKDTPASTNAQAVKHPGAGLTGVAFAKAIQEATAPGAAVRAASGGGMEARPARLPRVQPNFVGPPTEQQQFGGLNEGIRDRAFQFTPDPWGIDVSQAGMEANERARQMIEGRHINRLAAIGAAERAGGGSPQERDLAARKLNAEATALTSQPRPLEGEGGAFEVGKGVIENVQQRPPATVAQRQQAVIFDHLRREGAALNRAYATRDEATINDARATYERILRDAELMLSSIAGRPITGSRPASLDLGSP